MTARRCGHAPLHAGPIAEGTLLYRIAFHESGSRR